MSLDGADIVKDIDRDEFEVDLSKVSRGALETMFRIVADLRVYEVPYSDAQFVIMPASVYEQLTWLVSTQLEEIGAPVPDQSPVEPTAVAAPTDSAEPAVLPQGPVPVARGSLPFGWIRNGDEVVPYPKERRIMEMIEKGRATRKTFREIAEQLNAAGLTTRRGTPWSIPSVNTIWQSIRRNVKYTPAG